MNRKNFLYTVAGGTTGFLLLNNFASGQTNPPKEEVPPYPLDMVKEFVIAGHKDLPRVQTMVAEHPNLVHCKYDWGNGDFEEAIEGAGHMGNKEIAQYLIDAGSRVTLFVLTMLGKTDLVKPVLEAYPKLIFANGPHGFTLLHHAKQGGKEAGDLYNYLQEKGLKDTWVKIK
ncbi:MAG: hypothetical protein ABI480_08035 [Chitinophagaceae bacterium]